jgi:hypothetical protein
MICRVCQGTGEVVKSFLWLFTRRRPCSKCGGTGQLDALGHQTRHARSPTQDRWTDNDYPTSVPDSYASSTGPSESAFVVGSGGRSGGGGGGASWADERGPRDASHGEREGPLVVDPFAATGETAEAMSAEAFDSSGGDSGSDGGDAGGGTAY